MCPSAPLPCISCLANPNVLLMPDVCMYSHTVRFQMDNCNKVKNWCSKEIGRKMKNKQPVGDSDEVPEGIKEKLDTLVADDLVVSHFALTITSSMG